MHLNKAPFLGILAVLDVPSDKSPSGARGHRVVITRAAAQNALDSLVGMAVNLGAGGHHNFRTKAGVIECATIEGNEIWVSGYLWKRDLPKVIDTIAASASDWGMSYEIADAYIEDMHAEVWTIRKATFTGASILPRAAAAYGLTDFVML